MKSSMLKKSFSLILSLVMLLTMVPATVFAAEKDLRVLMQFTAASSADFHRYYNKVYTVTFLDEIDRAAMNGALEKWDVSANSGSEEVMAWMYLNEEATAAAGDNRYDVYIAGEGGVAANPKSGFIFYGFSVLESVYGGENFKTGNATTFEGMFQNCNNLKNTSFKGWDTSNVTNMSAMFRNCFALTELDLSSFDTSKVTTMRFMFYLCKKLKNIYVGDGWTTESIGNLYDGVFNCCYAIIGGTDDDKLNQEIYESNPNPHISNHYAVLKEDGGYFDYKAPEAPAEYTVSYEFVGDVIPDGITAPDSFKYNEGSEITVADVPTKEGYIFSGWTTEDANITDGKFTVNNDVHFVGTWSKLYKVIYKYNDKYTLPDGAPALPETVEYKAGETVTVNDVPFVDGYIFIGWDTKDADTNEYGKFVMPEEDVVLYGYFKKPVESVKINGSDNPLVLNVGQDKTINVTVKPEDATNKELVYESGDEKVAKVDKDGKITAVGEGKTTITVYSKDDPTKRDTIEITVKIPVTEITVENENLIINTGEEKTIEVTVNPSDATNKSVTYKSEDESIVKVDKDGKIIGCKAGTTTITITSDDDNTVTKTVTVTVKNPVTELNVGKDFTIGIGDTKNVEATVNENATNKELIYDSSDPGIAKVDSNGEVIGVGEGTVTITVKSVDNPELIKTVTVTVVKKHTVTYIFEGEVIPEGATAPVDDDKYNAGTVVNVKTVPDYDGYTFLGWTTEDTEVENGSFTINKDVVFSGKFKKNVTGITANEKFTLKIDETINIGATVTPEDATDKTVSYKSEDESIVTVDGNGNVTAIGEGTTTITITSNDNSEIKKVITVTVVNPEPEVPEEPEIPEEPEKPEEPEYTITVPEIFTVYVGENKNLGVVITPDDGKIKPLYTSGDESIFTVDANGNIKAIKAGVTTISVDFGGGDIRVIPVTVLAVPTPPRKHHVCFGKTDGIGWYEVSVNGGDFFPQGPNSTLEVEEGSILVVRVQDMWIDDEFTFYVNGSKVPLDPANTITVVVDGYMLIGALSMDVEVPDVEESLTLLEKISNFFVNIINWFKNLFKIK